MSHRTQFSGIFDLQLIISLDQLSDICIHISDWLQEELCLWSDMKWMCVRNWNPTTPWKLLDESNVVLFPPYMFMKLVTQGNSFNNLLIRTSVSFLCKYRDGTWNLICYETLVCNVKSTLIILRPASAFQHDWILHLLKTQSHEMKTPFENILIKISRRYHLIGDW